MSRIRAWLDATPIADIAMTFMREATGRADPVEPLRPTRPAALAPGRRVAFWSLVGGVGASTVAGLVAHRSAGAGRAPLLVDLDRWAPSLALRARVEAATIADALVQPGRERRAGIALSAVPFLPVRRTSRPLRCRSDHRVIDAIANGGAGRHGSWVRSGWPRCRAVVAKRTVFASSPGRALHSFSSFVRSRWWSLPHARRAWSWWARVKTTPSSSQSVPGSHARRDPRRSVSGRGSVRNTSADAASDRCAHSQIA